MSTEQDLMNNPEFIEFVDQKIRKQSAGAVLLIISIAAIVASFLFGYSNLILAFLLVTVGGLLLISGFIMIFHFRVSQAFLVRCHDIISRVGEPIFNSKSEVIYAIIDDVYLLAKNRAGYLYFIAFKEAPQQTENESVKGPGFQAISGKRVKIGDVPLIRTEGKYRLPSSYDGFVEGGGIAYCYEQIRYSAQFDESLFSREKLLEIINYVKDDARSPTP